MLQNTIVAEGVEAFEENIAVIEAHKKRPIEYLSLTDHNPYYHGPNRDDCLLVKFRREKTYDDHYLDIYKCLTHGAETCRCGMEWDYYQQEKYLEQHA